MSPMVSGPARSTIATRPSGCAMYALRHTTKGISVTIASRCTSRKTRSSSMARIGSAVTTPSAINGITSIVRYSLIIMRLSKTSEMINSTSAKLAPRTKGSEGSLLEAREPLARLKSACKVRRREVQSMILKIMRSFNQMKKLWSSQIFQTSPMMLDPLPWTMMSKCKRILVNLLNSLFLIPLRILRS